MEQRIFLDIACCTEGHLSRNSANCVIGDSFVNIGIDSLVDKSLVSSEGHLLVMHDLVREMGRKIVRQQSTEEPGKRSRIWANKDIYNLLKNNTGSSKIAGISQGSFWYLEKVDLSPTFFSNMHNLRLLNLSTFYANIVKIPQGIQYLPDTLTCLVWQGWPLKYLAAKFMPHNLVVLKMPSSRLKKLWNGVHDLRKLRYIDLNCSENLIELPDLSQASNLEHVDLSYCTSLRRVPSCLRFRVVDNLPSLSQCDRRKCDSWQCWTIGYLNLTECSVLEIFPEISGSVKELICGSSLIAQLPSSICYLNCLESLSLWFCHSLKNLPSAMRDLRSLKYLYISQCSSLDSLPELPTSIVELSLNLINIKELPSYLFEGLSCLEELNLARCANLSRLPSNVVKLKSLRSLNLSVCENLKTFTEILEPMETLKILDSTGSGIRELPTSIENLVGLESLTMIGCRDLEILPYSMYKLSRLQTINLFGCSKLKCLPPVTSKIPNMISFLHSVDLSGSAIEGLPGNINQLRNLITLRLRGCTNLKYLSQLPLSLRYLDASGCENLAIISDSRAVLAQGWENKDYSLEPREFLYYECLKLDPDMCNIIVTEFQMRSLFIAVNNETKMRGLYTAAIYASKYNETEESSGYSHVDVCCPGKKTCISIESNQDERSFSSWDFAEDTIGGEYVRYIKNSENMFMWYVHDDDLRRHDAAKLEIKFDLKAENYVINSCGIRLLQLQDIEDLGIATDQHAPGNLKANVDDHKLNKSRYY